MCADILVDLAEVLSAAGDRVEVVDTLRRARELYLRKGNVVSAALAAQLVAAAQ